MEWDILRVSCLFLLLVLGYCLRLNLDTCCDCSGLAFVCFVLFDFSALPEFDRSIAGLLAVGVSRLGLVYLSQLNIVLCFSAYQIKT